MAAGERGRSQGMRGERAPSWMERGARAVSLVLFATQVGNNLRLWLQRPTMSSYSVSDESPLPLPGITVCPNPPFSVDALLTLGLDLPASATAEELRLAYDRQAGVEADSATVWNRTAWPLGAVVQQLEVASKVFRYPPWQTTAPEWSVSYTPLGPCFTLAPKATFDPSLGVTLRLRDPLKSCVWESLDEGKQKFLPMTPCETVDLNCNTSCAWENFVYSFVREREYLGHNVILHPVNEPPTLAVTEAVVPLAWSFEKYAVEVLVEPVQVHRMDRRKAPCNSSSGYSEAVCRQRCAEPCHPRLLHPRPLHPTWAAATTPTTTTSVACNTAPGPETFQYEKVSEEQYACWRRCRLRCSETVFSYKVSTHGEHRENIEQVYTLNVRPKSRIVNTITEMQAYPTAKLLADVGGSLGLFLGVSLLTFWSTMVNLVTRLTLKVRGEIQRRMRNRPVTSGASGPTGSSVTTVIRMGSKVFKMTEMVARDSDSSAGAGDARERWWSGPPAPAIRPLLHAMGITALSFCAALHFLVSLTAYVRQPVVTYLSVESEPLTFPPVTVCPALPFKLTVLLDRGLNVSNVHCPEYSSTRSKNFVLTQLLQDMPGLWDDSVNLTSLWKSAGLQSSDYLPDSSLDDLPWNHWRPILTTNNVCYQLANTSQTRGLTKLVVILSHTNIKRELSVLHRDCYPHDYERLFWVMLPEKGSTPLAVSRSRVYRCKVELRRIDHLKITPLVVRRLPPCRNPPYRRSVCLQRCQLERAARRINCSLPYLPDTDLPTCHTQDQYRESRKYILAERPADETQPCEHLCDKDCESTYYYVDDVSTPDSHYIDGFEATLSWKDHFVIQEFWSTSFPRALSEVGGIVGLYLGWSVLSSGQGIADFLRTTDGDKYFSRRTRRRIRKALLLTLYSLCAVTAGLFWLHFAREFAWYHPHYTRFETHRLRPQDLPAMTVCRWPPFNLSRLLEDGLIFNASAYCRNYGNRFSRCFRGTQVIQELPGMFGRPLDQVWAAAAWKLQDLVTQYTVDSHTFLVQAGDGDGDGAWRPTLTESNVCYTFTPPSKSSLSYVVVLNADYHGSLRVRTNKTLDLLLSSLQTGNRPFTQFTLHDRREQVYTWRQGFTASLSSTDTSQTEISVTVKTDSRLPGEGRPCEQSPRYSQATCLARCRASYYAEVSGGCRLPYITWRPDLPFCNETQYAHFPRQLGLQTSDIYVVKDVADGAMDPTTAACADQCPPACTRRMFSFRSRLTSRQNSVMVKFAQSTYDWLREEDGYSWSQLVSDVGGVAGFMMGASFLSVCGHLLRLLRRRRRPPPTQRQSR